MQKTFNEKYKIDGNYIEEELIILNELRSSMKFQSSICNFLVENKPLDLYKIPLTFTDEFISYIIIKKLEIDTSKIEYFNLIDKLYLDQKQNDYKIIDFSSDITKYLDNYKDEFNKYIDERNANIINSYSQFVENNLGEKVLKYQTYELDLNIILKYACIIKGLSEENYIKLISDNFEREDNQIKDISLKEIETKIENYFLDNTSISNLTNSEICCINIILLFSISLNILPANINCNSILSILFQNFIVFRKYCSILLQMIYKIIKNLIGENNSEKINQLIFCAYPCINYIRNNHLVPNEDLMTLINKFDLNETNDEIRDVSNPVTNLNDDEYSLNLSENNLFITYNFSPFKFYDEKFIFNKVNIKNEGNLIIDNINMIPKIRYAIKNDKKVESAFFSQKKLWEILTKEYIKYKDNMDVNTLNRQNILDACLNIFIFMRNDEKFKWPDEAWKFLEIIFSVFLKLYKII